jgi:hypothetical protein
MDGPVFTREQCQALDRRAVDEYGMSSLVLMENAGRCAVDVLERLGIDGPVVIVWMMAIGDLMTRPDEDFPGRSDKPAWAVILTFSGVLGAIVYFLCRPRRGAGVIKSKFQQGFAPPDEPFTCLQCGQIIQSGETACSACGWSYSEWKQA